MERQVLQGRLTDELCVVNQAPSEIGQRGIFQTLGV